MDVIPQFVGPTVFEQGIYLPAGQGRVAFALRSDMGEAIANALVKSNCTNQTYMLTGNETYSFDDIAAALTTLSGKTVTYTPAEKSAFEAQLKGRSLPAVTVSSWKKLTVPCLTSEVIKSTTHQKVRTDHPIAGYRTSPAQTQPGPDCGQVRSHTTSV